MIYFVRAFYKESNNTPKDFISDGSSCMTSDFLFKHEEDFISSIQMSRKIKLDGQLGLEWENRCEN